jgi:hypothetical protein
MKVSFIRDESRRVCTSSYCGELGKPLTPRGMFSVSDGEQALREL